MEKQSMGNVIRSIRKEKKITQEKLAEGICAVSTLSKIENGSQVPSRHTFELLMERLGEPGFSYFSFANEREMQVKKLQKELLAAMEFQQEAQVEEKLWILEQIKDSNHIWEHQFCQMVQILWYQISGAHVGTQTRELISLFQMTHPDFDGIHTSMDMRLNQIETLLLNNIGISYLAEERYQEAMAIFLQLYQICQNHTNTLSQENFYKQKAGICGNIAVCARHLKMFDEALYYCNKGIAHIGRAGNWNICLHLLHTRSMVSKERGDMDAFFQDMFAAKNLYQIMHGNQEVSWDQEDYLHWGEANRII